VIRFLAIAALAAAACAETPLTADQTALLGKARSVGLQYSKSLPDFICTQIVRRVEDRYSTNRWLPIDTLTIKVSYSGREDYQVVLRNGFPAESSDYRAAGGPVSSGEFGSRLRDIFEPASAAEFGWKGWANVRHRRVAVFAYRVSAERSKNVITNGAKPDQGNSAVVGFHGEVSVEPESGAALRVTLIAEMPARFPITQCSSWTEYDRREVAGTSYLLPVTSETKLARGRYQAANHIDFREYRKFGSDTTITFK
jgi:hypothetical protein